MLDHHETHGLGLRGLDLKARRTGDHAAARQFAMRANADAEAAWAGQAVLDDCARRCDWPARLPPSIRMSPPGSSRGRPRNGGGVIKTGVAEEAMERDPKGALLFAQEACRLAPTLAPGAAICGRLTARGRLSRRDPHPRRRLSTDAAPRLCRPYLVFAKAIGRGTAGPGRRARPGRAERSHIALTVGRAELRPRPRPGAAAIALLSPRMARMGGRLGAPAC